MKQPGKTEEMEDTSRSYGILVHACGLETKSKRVEYSAKIKAKVSLN